MNYNTGMSNRDTSIRRLAEIRTWQGVDEGMGTVLADLIAIIDVRDARITELEKTLKTAVAELDACRLDRWD